jgi:hypothetical protein
MRHPTEGILRRLVDEPAGVADADRQHVASCPLCLTGLAAAREEASVVGAALPPLAAPGSADVDAAWHRLRASLGRSTPGPVLAAAPRARRKVSLRSPVVAALGAALLLAGGGVAAANDWFQIFHTERIQAVSVEPNDLVGMPDLSAYGDLQTSGQPRLRPAADAAEAQSATGLSVPRIGALPRGVTGQPVFQVGDQVSATFTFSAAKAAASAAAGRQLPPMPPGLDGSQVRLVAGPGIAEIWSQGGGQLPTLLVARVVAPTADSSGVPFDTMRSYLLSLPGLPADVAEQLRTFEPDASTLPLPVPADQVNSSTTDVGGHQATVLTARNGSMAGVVWVDSGVVTAVAGSLSSDEVLAVARGLQ